MPEYYRPAMMHFPNMEKVALLIQKIICSIRLVACAHVMLAPTLFTHQSDTLFAGSHFTKTDLERLFRTLVIRGVLKEVPQQNSQGFIISYIAVRFVPFFILLRLEF